MRVDITVPISFIVPKFYSAFFRTDSPKNQYVFLYPGAAPQLPLIALRQEDGGTPDILSQFNNWWTDFQMNFGQSK